MTWPDELFDHRDLTADAVTAIGEAGLAAADATVAEACAVAARDDAVFGDVIGRLDRAIGDLGAAHGRSGFMVRVHPDDKIRAAAADVDERVTTWRRSLPQRDAVAAAVGRYAASADAATLAGEERRLLEHWQRDLRRAGHGLPTAARDEVRQLTARVVALEAEFERNVDEWSDGLDMRREDLAGLPETYIAGLAPGSTPDTLRVSLDYPDYYPFMETSARRDLREALARKMADRAAEVNRGILDEALAARRRHAALLGYASWADYRIEPKMARTPERVAAFHDGIFPPLQALARDEYAAMTLRLTADTGATQLASWDVRYYDTRIRSEEHGVDAATVAEYLPLAAVFDGMLDLCAEVFDLRFVEHPEPRAWHPEVRLFEVRDGTSGERLGWCYTDLHPRPGKFGHAMAWPVRYADRGPDGRRRGGISCIVANLPRSTSDSPALLRHDDVVTLFHEFGHVLHEVLGTNAWYGTSMGEQEDDFPEAVSQIMENWAWEPTVLTRVSRHHRTAAPMPADLAERLAASRSVNLGSRYLASFGGYGAFDLSIHGPEPVDLDDAMRAADAIRLLPTIEGTFWPASFAHLMGGYDAGYYGYLWSLVYGDDLWSRFAEQGVTSPTVGLAYRREILEPGSSRDAEALVEAFLGRPSNDAAFLERTGIVRTPA
jgi:Zn-dependent oligopeptidase